MSNENSHSKMVGYLLWMFGFLGTHRFYYGKPISGSIYFVSSTIFASILAFFWPLAIFIIPFAVILGIAWLIDLFLIPSMDQAADYKYADGHLNYNLAWLLLTFLGLLGVHRFYMGKWITGLLYLCTGGLGGLGYIYDFWTLNEQISKLNTASK